jgi:hypothetical protein
MVGNGCSGLMMSWAGRVSARTLIALAIAFTAVITTSAAISSAGAVRVLGAAKPANARCPADCLVEARVTGFQVSIGSAKNPFVVPADGRIVAWSIKLGEPAKSHLRFFNESFGPSQARISILKPVRIRRGSRPPKLRYRLLRQSPAQNLRPFFGTIITFGLERPLPVRKGNVVALTIPSWAPAFADGGSSRWRASRARTSQHGPCVRKRGFANIDAGAPHEQERTERRYGCSYSGSRLLYTARLVRSAAK